MPSSLDFLNDPLTIGSSSSTHATLPFLPMPAVQPQAPSVSQKPISPSPTIVSNTIKPQVSSPVKIVSSRNGAVAQKSGNTAEAQKALDALNAYEASISSVNPQGLTLEQMIHAQDKPVQTIYSAPSYQNPSTPTNTQIKDASVGSSGGNTSSTQTDVTSQGGVDTYGYRTTGKGGNYTTITVPTDKSGYSFKDIVVPVMMDANGNIMRDGSGKPIADRSQITQDILLKQGISPGSSVFSNYPSSGTNMGDASTGKPSDIINGAVGDVTSGIMGASKGAVDSALLGYQNALKKGVNGPLSESEQKQVDDASLAAKSEYDALISDAMSKKQQGMGRAVVGAGQAGGFLNSQVAGQAAVAPTSTENAFTGIGGDLERVQSAYDSTIYSLKNQQQIAMVQARAAATKAIQTGKQSDLDNLKSAFDVAQKAYQDQIDLADRHALNIVNLQQAQKDLKKPYTVSASAGQAIIDPVTKEVIYQAPEKATTDQNNYKFYSDQETAAGRKPMDFNVWQNQKGSKGVMGEYEYAKNQGFKGTLLDYIGAKRGAGGVGELDADTVNMAADQYLTTGQLPSLGTGGSKAKLQILSAAADLAASRGLTGKSVALNKAAFDAGSASLKDLQKRKGVSMAQEDSASKALDLAYALGDKVDRTGSPLVNKYLMYVKGQIAGDADTANFEGAVRTAATEYAKVVSGQTTGAGVTEAADREVQEILNATYSQEAFKKKIETLKADMQFKAGSWDDQIQATKDMMSTLGSDSGGSSSGSSSQDSGGGFATEW